MPVFKISGRLKVLLAGLALLVLLASVVVVWNTLRLRDEVGSRTEHYVSDVSLQLSDSIDSRLSNITAELNTLGDSLLQVSSYEQSSQQSELEHFLRRKAKALGYQAFIITDISGVTYQSQASLGDVFSLPGVQASLAGENGVSFLENESILYSVPLRRDGRVVGVLGGVRAKRNMQALIQPRSFSGRGLTCVIDRNESLVISATDAAPFTQLDSIFSDSQNTAAGRDIVQMQQDIAANRPGIFRFNAQDGSDLLLAYNPLQSYDWILLTLVPSDIISANISAYLSQTFLICFAIILLMAAILCTLFLGLRLHFRQMEQAVFFDPVTGGMSNAAFQYRCASLLPKSPPGTYAIVLLNIKKFKLVNVEFGSQQGDAFLREIMRILEQRVDTRGFAARMHADLFFLCLRESDPGRIAALIQEIQDDISEKMRRLNASKGLSLPLVVQSGVYMVDEPSLEITVMQDRARVACRDRAPSEDGVCKFFNIAVLERLEYEQGFNGLFAHSLSNGDFQVYLQPKVRLTDGQVAGAEALARWQHPTRGLISPGEFIPIFEANGNICQLDLYIFQEVCRLIRRWADEGRPLFPISVNLSRQHFQQPGFLQAYIDLAQRYQVPRDILELELTEAVFFDDGILEMVKAQIQEMHRAGFRCSLDDFGAGFSSLGLLKEFDVDVIKLDRSLSKDLEEQKAAEIIAAITALMRKLGVTTVAEGIEKPEQLRFLKTVDCDLIQGYIFSKPLPIPAFETWLAAYERGR